MDSPAKRVIEKCGSGNFRAGIKVVAEITGTDKSRVHRWTYSKEKGGTDGLIPSQQQQALLDGARARGIALEPADFFDFPTNSDISSEPLARAS